MLQVTVPKNRRPRLLEHPEGTPRKARPFWRGVGYESFALRHDENVEIADAQDSGWKIANVPMTPNSHASAIPASGALIFAAAWKAACGSLQSYRLSSLNC